MRASERTRDKMPAVADRDFSGLAQTLVLGVCDFPKGLV